ASSDVTFISRKQQAMTNRIFYPKTPKLLRRPMSPGFEQRAARLRRQLATLLPMLAPPTGQGSVTTEGDLTHRAFDARGTFGTNGNGLKIGVLSDGVSNMALSQATGDLPPTCPTATPHCVTVLPGQTGGGDEGTAMLEIIYDMAPGASLYFATAFNNASGD